MTKWDRIIADVQNTDDTDGALAACAALDRAADRSRLPHLYSLLKGGSNFFVREAAAVPVARLDGLRALSHLLEAMRLGGKEGHDNDGMCSLISDVVSENPRAAAPILTEMIRGRSAQRRADAA